MIPSWSSADKLKDKLQDKLYGKERDIVAMEAKIVRAISKLSCIKERSGLAHLLSTGTRGDRELKGALESYAVLTREKGPLDTCTDKLMFFSLCGKVWDNRICNGKDSHVAKI